MLVGLWALLAQACRAPEGFLTGGGGATNTGGGGDGSIGSDESGGSIGSGGSHMDDGGPDGSFAGTGGGSDGRAALDASFESGVTSDARGDAARQDGGSTLDASAARDGAGPGDVGTGAADERLVDAGAAGCTAVPQLDVTLCGLEHFYFCDPAAPPPGGCTPRGNGDPTPYCCP